MTIVAVAVVVAVVVLLGVGAAALLRRRRFVDEVDGRRTRRCTPASVAARHLRGGLTPDAAARAARQLRPMLGSRAIALTDPAAVLAWTARGVAPPRPGRRAGRGRPRRGAATTVLDEDDLSCGDPDCPIRSGVVAPVTADERVVGGWRRYGPSVSPGLVRATEELAGWISTQVELSELERQRSRLIEAELRALRAQISPHFVYNCLSAIGSFVRTDPDRARELVLEFADFTATPSAAAVPNTTLRDELRNIERYLVLEQARFGERLVVQLTIAPEVLPVAVPFLSVQPLVENAVRHGLERKPASGT